MAVPRVWEMLRSFKHNCENLGWSVSENEDWVKADGLYHNFLWIRTVRPAAVKEIALKHKCAIRKRTSYEIVDVAYIAWLLYETPSEELLQAFVDDSELSKRVALYDLSAVYSDEPTCLRLNQTDSRVFMEFEKFLERKWKIKFKQIQGLLTAKA
jgi:hypothetical protein